MREIVLDTETTGFEPSAGDRLVEIGAIELHHRLPTGKIFHTYLNPERSMPAAAFRVHGLSEAFLSDKPLFSEVVDEFLHFIGRDPLVIHNAPFDMKFLNAELARFQRKTLPYSQAIDTLVIAKKKFPGAPASLDALCRRFNVDNARRTNHGALLDSELLAEVYLELRGGRQRTLDMAPSHKETLANKPPAQTVAKSISRNRLTPVPKQGAAPVRKFKICEEESAAHRAFLKKLNDPFWLRP